MKTIEVYLFSQLDEKAKNAVWANHYEDILDCYRDYLIGVIDDTLSQEKIQLSAENAVKIMQLLPIEKEQLINYICDFGWYFTKSGFLVESHNVDGKHSDVKLIKAYNYNELDEKAKTKALADNRADALEVFRDSLFDTIMNDLWDNTVNTHEVKRQVNALAESVVWNDESIIKGYLCALIYTIDGTTIKPNY